MRYVGDGQLKGMEIFDCNLKTSCEVLQLAEEINQRDDVEWAEPNMSFPVHFHWIHVTNILTLMWTSRNVVEGDITAR